MDKSSELLRYGSVFVATPAHQQALYQSLGVVGKRLPDGRCVAAFRWPTGTVQVRIVEFDSDSDPASTTSTPGAGPDVAGLDWAEILSEIVARVKALRYKSTSDEAHFIVHGADFAFLLAAVAKYDQWVGDLPDLGGNDGKD